MYEVALIYHHHHYHHHTWAPTFFLGGWGPHMCMVPATRGGAEGPNQGGGTDHSARHSARKKSAFYTIQNSNFFSPKAMSTYTKKNSHCYETVKSTIYCIFYKKNKRFCKKKKQICRLRRRLRGGAVLSQGGGGGGFRPWWGGRACNNTRLCTCVVGMDRPIQGGGGYWPSGGGGGLTPKSSAV